MVRALRAGHVIDYTQEDFSQTGWQYDLIFDTIGNRSVAEYARALKSQGHFVTTTFLPVLVFRGRWPSKDEGQKMINMMAKSNRVDLAYIAELMEAGKVKPVIDRCHPLNEVPEALRYLGKGHTKGKVIITTGIS